MTSSVTNPIGFLQELCQKNSLAFPVYTELECRGPPHSCTFYSKCVFEGYQITGSGFEKREAKRVAASNMLLLLKEQGFLNENNDLSQSESARLNGTETRVQSSTLCMTHLKSPISMLFEYCSKMKIAQPLFVTTESECGTKTFSCKCTVGAHETNGWGDTKQTAKTESSTLMCKILLEGKGAKKSAVYDSLISTETRPQMEIGDAGNSSVGSSSYKRDPLSDFNGELLDEFKEKPLCEFDTEDADSTPDADIIPKLENLLLDDSVVEVEPTTSNQEKAEAVKLEE